MTDGDRESWLNGWKRTGDTVIMGSGIYCAGGGKIQGILSVVIRDDWVPPKNDPDWPFPEADCPVCSAQKKYRRNIAITVEDAANLPIATLRQAISMIKNRK